MNKEINSIGIIGYGVVGRSLAEYYSEIRGVGVKIYDKYKTPCKYPDNLMNKCDLIFICVPTPFNKEIGFDDTEVIDALNFIYHNEYFCPVIIKSTIVPGTTERL